MLLFFLHKINLLSFSPWRFFWICIWKQWIRIKINFINQMATSSVIVLGSTFTILAIYIIGSAISYLWSGSTACEYNIGCYAVQHSINRTDQVISHIASLQHLENMSKIVTQLQSFSVNGPVNLQNTSVQLASSFEKYIKKLTRQYDFNLQNVQINREVAKAEKQYLACKEAIDQNYSESDCKLNWEEYTNCSKKMEKMRFKLERLTEEEERLRGQIADIIKKPDSSISALELAKRVYNDSMQANQKLKSDLNSRLESLQQKIRQKSYQRDESLEKYELSFKNLRLCQDNKKKHDACEQISKEVRNINSENIAYLKVMMERKQQLLRNLQRILDAQKNSKQIAQLNQKYLRHKEEYIVMLKQFISLTRENEKACGCTPEIEAELKRQLDSLKNKTVTLNSEVREIQLDVDKINAKISHCEQQREQIVKIYKKALEANEVQGNQTMGESLLSQLRRLLKEKYNQVLELRGIYQRIDGECETNKQSLNTRAREINSVTDCVGKKQYFLGLKHQTAQYIHSDSQYLTQANDSRKELAKLLRSFGPQ